MFTIVGNLSTKVDRIYLTESCQRLLIRFQDGCFLSISIADPDISYALSGLPFGSVKDILQYESTNLLWDWGDNIHPRRSSLLISILSGMRDVYYFVGNCDYLWWLYIFVNFSIYKYKVLIFPYVVGCMYCKIINLNFMLCYYQRTFS